MSEGKEMKYQHIAINKLVPYIRNYNKHPEEQITLLMSSFREFGVIAPIIIDEKKARNGNGSLFNGKTFNGNSTEGI